MQSTVHSKGLEDIVVWTEIVSHLKGSLEALESMEGFLSREQYQRFGTKRSRVDKGDERDRVYTLFSSIYTSILQKRHDVLGALFDLGDVCHHMWQRMKVADFGKFNKIHQVFIDEVQDLTQSEIAILFKFAEPNGMFLAGDTAQSVNKGVCFRFSEIKELFYKMKQKTIDDRHPIVMPIEKTLSNNYRCQGCIINCAAAVIELVRFLCYQLLYILLRYTIHGFFAINCSIYCYDTVSLLSIALYIYCYDTRHTLSLLSIALHTLVKSTRPNINVCTVHR
jgi:hypothetical protein